MTKKPTTGWILLHRKMQNHWIWQDANKFKCWIDILLTVNIEDKNVCIGSTIIECKRGQSLMSLDNWARRWGMSKSSVNRLFKALKMWHMIETENVMKTTRLTVCNYDSYQVIGNDNETIMKQKRNNRDIQLKEDINININIKETPFSKAFKDFSDMRKGLKKPMTARAADLILSKLEKFSEGNEDIKIQILEQSIERSWLGVFPLQKESLKFNIPSAFIPTQSISSSANPHKITHRRLTND